MNFYQKNLFSVNKKISENVRRNKQIFVEAKKL